MNVSGFPPFQAESLEELVLFSVCLGAECNGFLVLWLWCESKLCILLTYLYYLN